MRSPSSSPKQLTPCCSKVGLKRGPWTAEEDETLAEYIRREGEGRWRTVPNKAGLLRCGKSCRLRWMNYLRPTVKSGHISPDEEDLILRLHRLLGNRWSLIAGRIPGRTDNEIKNYWNTHLSKKLISQGIDPKTHKPLNPNPNSIDHDKNDCPSKAADDHDNLVFNPNINYVPSDENVITNNNIVQDGRDIGKMINDNDQCVDEEYGGHDLKKDSRIDCDDQGMMSNIEDGDHDDDMINCFTDDAFSSFLNSLINDDDMFNNQHQEQDHQQHDQA